MLKITKAAKMLQKIIPQEQIKLYILSLICIEKLDFSFSCETIQELNERIKAIDFNFLQEIFDFLIEANEKIKQENEVDLLETLQLFNTNNQIDFFNDNKEEDTFGNAFELLNELYSGKARNNQGEFFTSKEVARMLAMLVVDEKTKTVYDPTCGSGGLILQAIKINSQVEVYGQELTPMTELMARVNMFLAGINGEKINIKQGDVLERPQHIEQKFNAIISNPPYSVEWKGKDNPAFCADKRFCDVGALAPKSKADYAFILHSLFSLEDNGKAAFVVFPGILYRGGAEKKIREYLIENNYIDAIVLLPEKLFSYTQIATVLLILKKGRKYEDVLFCNASSLFRQKGKINIACENEIVDMVKARREEKGLSYVAKKEEIRKNDYTLSPSNYIDTSEEAPPVDIKALNKRCKQLRKQRENTLEKIDKLVDYLESM